MKRFVPLAFVLALSSCAIVTGTHKTATPSPASTFGPQLGGGIPGPPTRAFRSRVARVVDGDTVVLTDLSLGQIDRQTGGWRARLIGIDTPEVFGTVGCFGHEASNFTRSALLGHTVLVDYDIDTTDRFGRALVYIWEPDGSFFNARLAAEGYAYQLTIPPDVRYADLFGRLVAQARDRNLGLWRGC